MNNKLKKIIAILMLSVMIISSALMNGSAISAEANNTLYSNDFSSSLSGFANNSVGKITDEKYVFTGDMYNYISAVGSRKDVTIEADVSVTMGKSGKNYVNSMASLVLCSDNTAGNAYEYGIGFAKDGTPYVRLYLRSSSGTERILYQATTKIPGTTGTIAQRTNYKLKMGVSNGEIRCFINDELVVAFQDSTYTQGYAGLKSIGGTVCFDNVKVMPVAYKVVQGITLANTPEAVSILAELEFDIVVDYGTYYGTETISSDTEGVSIVGFDRTVGMKTVTVSYGGKSATFDVNVQEKAPETVLFSNTYNDGTTDFLYSSNDVGFVFAVAEGVLKAEYPKSAVSYNRSYTASAYMDSSKISSWNTYDVFTHAFINAASLTETQRQVYAEVRVAKDAVGNIYRFRVGDDGMAALYCGSTLLASKNLSESNLAPSYKQDFTIKVEVRERILICKVNGKTVIRYAGFERATCTPYLGLSAINGSVSFDNTKVTNVEKKSSDAVTAISLLYAQNNKAVTTETGNSLNTSGMYLKVTYVDGTTDDVGITDKMISGYTFGKSSTIKITYGKHSTKFLYTYINSLFADTFDDTYKSEWSMPNKSQYAVTVSNNMLNFKFTKDSDSDISFLPIVSTGSEWENYSVSADVAFVSTTRNDTYYSTVGLVSRRQGNYYYEFRLYHRYSSISAYLYRFTDEGNERVGYWSTSTLNSIMDEDMATGTVYNLRMVCKDNMIFCYLNDIMLGYYEDVYEDVSDTQLQKGAPGLKVINFSGTVDNYIVSERSGGSFSKLEVVGSENNVFKLYEGGEIDPADYKILLTDSDGIATEVPMTQEMLSPYENLEIGTYNLKITALGYTADAKVVISERHDLISELSDELEELKPSKMATEDKEEIDKLQDRYDALTPYETTLLSEKAVEKLQQATEKVYEEIYPELSNYDILTADAINEASEDVWNDGESGSTGAWEALNGYYGLYQSNYNLWGNAFRMNEETYGNIVSVSADFMMLDSDIYVGLILNYGEDGYYHTRISSKTRDDYDQVIHTLQLCKYSLSNSTLTSEILEVYEIELTEDIWFNMRMTYLKGMLTVYVNDVEILSYDDSSSVTRFDSGIAGTRVSEGNARFDNFTVYGTALEREEEVYVEPVVYKDDFEDEKLGTNPSHWIQSVDYTSGMENAWKVYEIDGNKVYGTKDNSNDTYTYLHAFDKNTTAEMKVRLDSATSDAKFGLLFRMAPESTYVRVGYDWATKCWYMLSVKGNGEDDIVQYTEDTFEVSKGQWYDISVSLENKNLVLVVNDKKILTIDGRVSSDGYGRIGVYSTGAEIYFDDVKYTIAAGILPTEDVYEATIVTEEMRQSLEIQRVGDQLIGINYNRYEAYVSSDNGSTWKDVTDNPNFTELLEGSGYTSYMQRSDGKYIQIAMSTMLVYESDDFLHWTQIGQLVPDEDIVDDRNRQYAMIHSNSLSEYTLADGTTRLFCPVGYRLFNSDYSNSATGNFTKIFYSDDGGRTWKCAENDTRDLLIYYDETATSSKWAESKIVQCADGTLRMYVTRTNEGCLGYTVSEDGGQTWSGYHLIPEMQCAASSFSVAEDSENPGTYYLIWVNDSAAAYGSLQNRTRISLARSTDGKEWEFLCDLERMCVRYSTDPASNSPLYQILDPSITVDGDYIHCTFGRSEELDETATQGTAANYHNFQQVRYVRLNKNSLVAKKWDSSTVADMKFPTKIEVTTLPDKVRFGYGDIYAVLGGKVTITALDGSKTEKDLNRFSMLEEPDMYTMGKQTVTIYDKNCFTATYDIEVVNKYRVKWSVSDGGTVEPKDKNVLEGENLTFETVADAGYKLKSVTVNGEKYRAWGGKVTVKDVHEVLEIEVIFVEKTIFDYLIWIIPTLLLLAIAGYIIWQKSNKKKLYKQETTMLSDEELKESVNMVLDEEERREMDENKENS